MAQIVINEISQNYQYSVANANFATVAMPITSCWGPAYLDIATLGIDEKSMLENTTWARFPATQAGLESFVSTYRGPASNYRLAKDYSYQMAMTLLSSGYDVLVCRLCPGTYAEGSFTVGTVAEGGEFTPDASGATFQIKAKYPGSFGNAIQVTVQKVSRYLNNNLGALQLYTYWNVIVYVVDASGLKTSVENLSFVLDEDNSTDTLLHINEIESNFLTFICSKCNDEMDFQVPSLSKPSTMINTSTGPIELRLTGGDDKAADLESADAMIGAAATLASARYGPIAGTGAYAGELAALAGQVDEVKASTILYREWLYNSTIAVFELLKDKLTYNFNRLIASGWDDQDFNFLNDSEVGIDIVDLSPLHLALMDTAYHSRCGTALLDIPRSLARQYVWNESTVASKEGYAQKLARYIPDNASMDVNASLYQTHSALFAPWGQYQYAGTSKQYAAAPSFLALLIQRAMILNQTVQYEWILPSNRRHNLNIGKLAYTVPKKVLDEWQQLDGVGVNALTNIPDLGLTVWGNSTLFEVPPATYQALANLSTRYLVNAVEDMAYRCGIQITFKYNNNEAYESFQIGMSPLLDTMKNVGAILDYRIEMSADINGLEHVNANTVLGKIYLVVPGVIQDIYVDLIVLPPAVDLDTYVQ